jgi:hypothetical protein
VSQAAEFLQRLDAVERRLAAHAQRDTTVAEGRHTDPDPPTGETWEWGQVWAHLGEFLPYWLVQATDVVSRYSGEPVPFGRVKSDPERVAAIARDRNGQVRALWRRTDDGIAAVRVFLAELNDDAWTARGVHQTLGVMSLAQIVDEFMVGHLEQHAAQLDGLSS